MVVLPAVAVSNWRRVVASGLKVIRDARLITRRFWKGGLRSEILRVAGGAGVSVLTGGETVGPDQQRAGEV